LQKTFLRNVYGRKKIAQNIYPDDLTVDSFRRRADIGLSCAAQIGIHVAGQNGRAAEIPVAGILQSIAHGCASGP